MHAIDSEAPFEWTREHDDILRGVSVSGTAPDWVQVKDVSAFFDIGQNYVQLMSQANLTNVPSANQCARRHAHLHGIGVGRMRHATTVPRIQKVRFRKEKKRVMLFHSRTFLSRRVLNQRRRK